MTPGDRQLAPLAASTRWSLPAAFYSVIVKTKAIDGKYPGGRDAFVEHHRPRFRNGALMSVLVMATDDVDVVLSRLKAKGLAPGTDVAVADMVHGPLLPCPGMVFQCEDEFAFPPRWTVDIDRDYQPPAPSPSSSVATQPPERPSALSAPSSNPWTRVVHQGRVFWHYDGPEDDDGDDFYTAPGEVSAEVGKQREASRDWAVIATRTASGARDTWEEHLCARRTGRGLQLDVMAYEVLGEDELTFGDLMSTGTGPMDVIGTSASLRCALSAMGWSSDDLGGLLQALLALPPLTRDGSTRNRRLR